MTKGQGRGCESRDELVPLELRSFQRRRDAVLKLGRKLCRSVDKVRELFIFFYPTNEINLTERRAAVSTLAEEVRNDRRTGGEGKVRDFMGERRGACGPFFLLARSATVDDVVV